jgi:probable HAF family extracellular repeat protein
MFNLTVIGTLGGPDSRAFAIDAARQVVGDSNAAPNNDSHAMLFGGASQDLGVLVLPNPFGIPTVPIFDLSIARGIGRLPSGATLVAGFSSKVIFPAAVISRASYWVNNNLQDIGTLIPGPAFPGMFLGISQALAANDNGLIVGVSDIAALGPSGTALQRAFVFDANAGQMQALPTLSPDPNNPGQFLGSSKALGINNRGQIVGVSDTSQVTPSGGPVRHAFVFDLGTLQMQDLGTLITRLQNPAQTQTNSEARAINNRGQIVGVSDSLDANSGAVQRAFLFDPSGFVGGRTTIDLGTLNPANRPVSFFRDLGNSEANAINDRGDIVGVADTGQFDANGDPIRHGFIFDGGSQIDDLNLPALPAGWTIIEATGINSSGEICGIGVNATGTTRGLLLVP